MYIHSVFNIYFKGIYMNFYELIVSRESVRSYDPARPVDQETLRRIVEAGRLAPSAANRQPFKIMVISSNDMLEKIRPSYNRPWFKDAPHILLIIGYKNQAWVREYDCYNALETDLTIAMDHMILAAAYEGVATCWIANFNPTILRDALSLNEKEQVYALTPLGYPKPGFEKKGNKQRKSFQDVVVFM